MLTALLHVNDSRKKLHVSILLRLCMVTVPNGHREVIKIICYALSNTEKESLKELSLTLTLNLLFHRKSVTTVRHRNHFVLLFQIQSHFMLLVSKCLETHRHILPV